MSDYIFDQKPALEDLTHYGVKGMKWGVRKDTYYKKSSGSSKSSNSKKGTVGLTPGQQAIAAYGAVFAFAVLAQKTIMYRDSGRKDARKTGDKAFKKNTALSKKNLSVNKLHSDISKPINPGYGAPGTKMNCRRATFAYEMRRRGYDVKATKSHYASGQTTKGLKKAINEKDKDYQSIWGQKRVSTQQKMAKSSPEKKSAAIFDSLKQYPDGARGELGMGWTMGGGHSMSWEIVKGKPVIFDNQNGKKYASPAEFSKFSKIVLDAAHTRLDNKTINDDFIKRWVTDV